MMNFNEKIFSFRKLLYGLAFILSISPMANAYDVVSTVNANFDSDISTDLTDKTVHNAVINEDVDTAGSDTAYTKTWEENRAGKVQEEEKFYQTGVMGDSCEEPSHYVCPPLIDEKVKAGFRNRINYINLESGQISCSILRPLKDTYTPATINSEIPYYTQVFTNKACVEKYSPKSASNIANDETTKKLIEQNSQFLEDLKQLEYKYTVDYKQNGGDEFLDYADILDGLVSFDTNLFNFEQTLLTRDLKTRDGFTTLPNEAVVTKFKDSFSNLVSLLNPFGGDYQDEEFLANVENQAKIRDASSALANSSYFMLLDFWLKSNDVLVVLAQGLALFFVGYNVLFTWIAPALSNKLQKQASGENNPQRFGYGFVMLIMLFAGEVERVGVEYESKSQDIITSELVIQQTNLQNAIQFLYRETNHWADVLAETGTRAYLNSMSSSTGLFSEHQITALKSEQIIAQKAFDAYGIIDKEMCATNYNVPSLKGALGQYRNNTLNKKEGGENYYSMNPLAYIGGSTSDISSLRVNPYPKSEREAEAMMYADRTDNVYDNLSPYNVSDSRTNSGFIDGPAIQKFRDSYSSPLLMSGCYNNKKKMIALSQRQREIDAEFAKLSDPSKKDAKVEYLKVINDIQWGLYAKQGYLSIAYLPATSLLIDNIGIVGDYEERKSAIESATGNDEGAITDFVTGGLKSIAEDIPFLTMFGGYQIAKMVHPVKDFALNKIIDGADTVGSFLGPIGKITTMAGSAIYDIKDKVTFGKDEDEIDLWDLKIAAFLIKNIFETLIPVTLIVGSILIFTLLFIEKLFAFVASMFLLIYAFSKNQEERISSAVAKIFAVAFKTILIVICVFLSLYSLSLVESLEMIFVESFFQSMDMIENASWSAVATGTEGLDSFGIIGSMITFFFKKYIFFGVTKFAFMMLKLVLVVQMIWKMPGFMYELMYEKVQSVSDSVGDTLQSVNERQTMKV